MVYIDNISSHQRAIVAGRGVAGRGVAGRGVAGRGGGKQAYISYAPHVLAWAQRRRANYSALQHLCSQFMLIFPGPQVAQGI